MDNLLERTLSSLGQLADIRYKTERNILNELHLQSFRSNNKGLAELFRLGIQMLNTAVDNRYKLEQDLLKSMLNSARNDAQGADPTSPYATTSKFFAGNIVIDAYNNQSAAVIPLTIYNHYEEPQTVTIQSSGFREETSGQEISCKTEILPAQLTIAGNEAGKAEVHIAFEKGEMAPATTYRATLMIAGRETRLFHTILRMHPENGETTYPSVTFMPQN